MGEKAGETRFGDLRALNFTMEVFESTIEEHGLLQSKIRRDLHEIYLRLAEMDAFRKVAGNERARLELRQAYLQEFFHMATAAVDHTGKTGLLTASRQESEHRPWRVF